MHSNDENINYWPGFVDAIMNVLLNILFMLCIMAFGLGLVQNQVRETVNTSDEGDTEGKGSKQKNSKPSPKAFPTQETIDTFPVSLINLKTPAITDPNASTPEISVAAKLNEQNVLSLQFVRQSPEMLQELKTHLQMYLPQIVKPNENIVVWAVDNEETPDTNKLLFTRLVVVRNALVESGISPERIEVRMLAGESNKNALNVYLASSPHSP